MMAYLEINVEVPTLSNLVCDSHLVMFVQVLKETLFSGSPNRNHVGGSKENERKNKPWRMSPRQ